jgi:hypothetical protein
MSRRHNPKANQQKESSILHSCSSSDTSVVRFDIR